MKKILTSLIAVTAIVNAGLFSSVSGMTMTEIKAEVEYTIDTSGINPRIYEFTPAGAKYKHCILVILNGDNPSSTLQCFDKKGGKK